MCVEFALGKPVKETWQLKDTIFGRNECDEVKEKSSGHQQHRRHQPERNPVNDGNVAKFKLPFNFQTIQVSEIPTDKKTEVEALAKKRDTDF